MAAPGADVPVDGVPVDGVPVEGRRRVVSLPTRLTAIAALLVAATVLVVAGVAVRLMRDDLGASLDRRLDSAAASFRDGPAGKTIRVEQRAHVVFNASHLPQTELVQKEESPVASFMTALIAATQADELTQAAGLVVVTSHALPLTLALTTA